MRRLRQGPHDGVCDVERVEPDVAVLGRLRVEAARLRGRPVCVARELSPGCQAVRCCQVICRAVGQLSGTVRCLCQTSCQVLSVLSGAVRCLSDIRGAL